MKQFLRLVAVAVVLLATSGVDVGLERIGAATLWCGDVLVPGPGLAATRFGSAVALDAKHIYVGAPGAGGNAPSAGAVYAFTRSGELAWSFHAPADHALSNLGGALVLSGGVLAVGGEHERQGPGLASVFFLDATTGLFIQRFTPDGPSLVNMSFVNADPTVPGRFAVAYGHEVHVIDPAARQPTAPFVVTTDPPVVEPPMRGHETETILGLAIEGDRLVTLRGIGGTTEEEGRRALLESFDLTTRARTAVREADIVTMFPYPAEFALHNGRLLMADHAEQALHVMDARTLDSLSLVKVGEPHGATGIRGLALGAGLVVTATGGSDLEELGRGRGLSQIIVHDFDGVAVGNADDRIVTQAAQSGDGWAHTFSVYGGTIAVGAPGLGDGSMGYVRLVRHSGDVTGERLVCAGSAGRHSECAGVDDYDGDGWGRADEARHGTDPCRADTDGDGLWDSVEVHRGLDPLHRDTDRDGLPDRLEDQRYWTEPRLADTDGDGHLDGDEVAAGTDPRDPADPPRPLLADLPPLGLLSN